MGRIRFKFRKPLSLDGLFYSHGLMCASYPRTVLAFVGLVVISFSLPFFVTSSGDLNKPITWRSPWLNYRILGMSGEELEWIINKPSQSSGRTPSWFHGLPVAVVQQLYVHLHINCERVGNLCDRPYDSTSKLAAAHLIKKMEHTISGCRKFMHPSILNLTHMLGSVHATTPLPMGILSPVLDSYRTTWEDTPLDYQTIKELIYGGFWEHAHYSFNPTQEEEQDTLEKDRTGHNRRHVFALTLMFLAKGRGDFPELVKCVDDIGSQWEDQRKVQSEDEDKRKPFRFLKHIYYEREWSLMDFAPLMGVYGIVFLYISFSVGKIDLVKSKVGLGFTAFISVVASLTMSLGVCTFFGLSISLSGSEIYPYVVITIGLENILIIVKAVITTPEELEVKYRIAVGLSKEGWAITRNLVTLVAITSFGIVFFNYVLKEFCIIALVGLFCDGFLQLFFFPTVLSIDLRRLELSDLSSTTVPVPESVGETHSSSSCRPRCPSSFHQVTTPMRWHSKRIKFIYFLARTRIVSRLMMMSLFVLLCAVFVRTDTFQMLVNRIISSRMDTPIPTTKPHPPNMDYTATPILPHSDPTEEGAQQAGHAQKARDYSGDHMDVYWTKLLSALNENEVGVVHRSWEDGFAMTCEGGEMCWRPMVTTHWPRLLNYTGHATVGRFLTLLPPINLNFNLGHTSDTYSSPSPVSALVHFISQPLVIRLSFITALVIIIISYAVYLVQSSWYRHQRYLQSVKLKNYDKLTCLKGHAQDIDLMCVDGAVAVTSSLDGDVRVWDLHPMKRRCVRVISRSKLCHSPPPEVSSSSQRPAAEGCEATYAPTPGTATPTNKNQVFVRSGRRYSAISSHSSTMSDGYDFYGNSDSRSRPQSASRLSDVLDVSDSDHNDQRRSNLGQNVALGSRQSSALAWMQQQQHGTAPPNVPVREFPAAEKLDSGNPMYTSPQENMGAAVGGSLGLSSDSRTSGNPSAPPSSAQAHPTTLPLQNPASQLSSSQTLLGYSSRPQPPSQAAPQPSSQAVPHPSSQAMTHPPSQAPVVSSQQLHFPCQVSSPQKHSPQVHVQLDLEGDHSHTAPPRISSISSAMPTSYDLTNPPYVQTATPTAGGSYCSSASGNAINRHSQAPSSTTSITAWSHFNGSPLPIPNTMTTPPALPAGSSIAHTISCSSPTVSGPIPTVHVTGSAPPISGAGSATRQSQYRRGHARHASLGANISLAHRTHSRHRSLGSINVSSVFTPPFPPTLSSKHGSLGNLSQLSNNSTHGSEVVPSLLVAAPPHSPVPAADKEKGYDFVQHFNLFSQYTSNMALEYCMGDPSSGDSLMEGEVCPSPSPVWCMDVENRVVALGCKDGKVEVWHATTGSLIFEQTIGRAGVCTIAVGKMGIVAGQMDGSLSVMGHNGLLHHVIPAHDRAVSVLRLYGDSLLVSGSCDCSVKVHRTSTPPQHQLVCVNSIYVHEGRISALTIVESELKLGCVSGCSKGLVIHWNVNTGACISEFGTYNSAVLQLESTSTSVVGLFSEGCLRVWHVANGDLARKIALGEMCYNFTILTTQYVALSLESCIEVYDLDTGCKHSPEVELETGVSCSSVGRRVLALDEGSSVACTCGKDIYLIPCSLKLKND